MAVRAVMIAVEIVGTVAVVIMEGPIMVRPVIIVMVVRIVIRPVIGPGAHIRAIDAGGEIQRCPD
jgi:hypothetical protein